MIVVEGTDNVGKTHLAQALVKELNARKYPHVYQHLSKLPECFDKTIGYTRFMHPHVVFDRFYVSRLAYGLALENQQVQSFEQYRWQDARMRLVGGFTVLIVSVNEEKFRARWGGKSEMYTCDMAWKVNQYFRSIACDDDQARHYYELPELPIALGYDSRHRPDVDMVICVDTDIDPEQWPTSQVDRIVGAYTQRLDTVWRIAHDTAQSASSVLP